MAQHIITFNKGKAAAIYNDALLPYFKKLGPYEIARASDVEPDGQGWSARIRPWVNRIGFAQKLSGLKIRLGPYPTRQAALDAEVAYLRHVLKV